MFQMRKFLLHKKHMLAYLRTLLEWLANGKFLQDHIWDPVSALINDAQRDSELQEWWSRVTDYIEKVGYIPISRIDLVVENLESKVFLSLTVAPQLYPSGVLSDNTINQQRYIPIGVSILVDPDPSDLPLSRSSLYWFIIQTMSNETIHYFEQLPFFDSDIDLFTPELKLDDLLSIWGYELKGIHYQTCQSHALNLIVQAHVKLYYEQWQQHYAQATHAEDSDEDSDEIPELLDHAED
ncbi:hypothetical protein K435DRAFT_804498 [Dendrothele bispora CBS 962.96]|uniref:HAM1-like N-terminal domain-containing protein n=1 Tax=Dendrothele bispora (strain CBS 962.96) TaxID=1314807 RepID=A0A4S8LE39_DENBC|nr:hypothetical protein K435DRAFT_804498 [Dendrothele bispora CBS 962.96]